MLAGILKSIKTVSQLAGFFSAADRTSRKSQTESEIYMHSVRGLVAIEWLSKLSVLVGSYIVGQPILLPPS